MKQLSHLHSLAKKATLRETMNAVGVAVGLGITVLVLSLKTESERA